MSYVFKGSFWNCCIFFHKTPNIQNKGWTRRDYPWLFLSKTFDASLLTMESFTIELVSNASAQYFPENTLRFFTIFYRSTWNWKANRRLLFRKYLTQQCAKTSQRENSCFWVKFFKVVWTVLSGTRSLPLQYGYCWTHENSHSRKTQSQRKLNHSVSRNAKKWDLPCEWTIWSCIL